MNRKLAKLRAGVERLLHPVVPVPHGGIVAGERFQSLCEIGFYSERSEIIEQQMRCMAQSIECIDTFPSTEIRRYGVIFCYSHDVGAFLTKFHPYLKNETVLVTHNSDAPVDRQFLSYLEGPAIKVWYAQNRYVEHPKLRSIPIGVGNGQWPHGNQELLYWVRSLRLKKRRLVLKNFAVGSNLAERQLCHTVTERNGLAMEQNTDLEQYWRRLSESYFSISPPGNGVDCHRIWECLLLRTVPVVKYHECHGQFLHLPILFINDWEEVTIEFLENKRKSIDWKRLEDIPELYMDFYRGLISHRGTQLN